VDDHSIIWRFLFLFLFEENRRSNGHKKAIPEQIVKEINFQANVLFSLFSLMMSLEVLNFFYTICQESMGTLITPSLFYEIKRIILFPYV
jgi:hypothetical protein